MSWSGGKDSCLALYKALQKGFEVSYLLNFASKDERCMAHGVSSKLVAAQSEAIGIPSFRGRSLGRPTRRGSRRRWGS